MRYAKILKNDTANGQNICVSFFLQGCPHHCKNCFNPETWDFEAGQEFTYDTLQEIVFSLTKNNVHRDLNIMGGEPLCPENLFLTDLVITYVKQQLPNTKIYIWTGYLYEDLKKSTSTTLRHILATADTLIDGPYIDSERDITLLMRGSRNQRIIDLSAIT